MDYVLIFSSCFKCIQLIVLCQHLDHLAVVRSADLFGHFLAPRVWLVVPRGTLYVGRVTLRLKPGPAHRLARGAVVVRVVLALLQCQHVTVLAVLAILPSPGACGTVWGCSWRELLWSQSCRTSRTFPRTSVPVRGGTPWCRCHGTGWHSGASTPSLGRSPCGPRTWPATHLSVPPHWQWLTLVMHHEPSGPGVALEKSTMPEKSGSSGSWMALKGRSGSGPALLELRERARRRRPAWRGEKTDNYIIIWHSHTAQQHKSQLLTNQSQKLPHQPELSTQLLNISKIKKQAKKWSSKFTKFFMFQYGEKFEDYNLHPTMFYFIF